MKPTSIIFIVVSVVLIISGIVTVGIANQLAASEGVEIITPKSEDGENYVETYDYSADYIGQININVSNAEINIIGGSTQPYVELINFPEGLYEFSHGDKRLTFSNNAELSDISALTSLVTNFKGLRSFVNYYNMHSLPKKINIYICPIDPVNSINITVHDGNVNVKDINMAADYNINIGNGDLTVNGVTTKSYINAVIKQGDVALAECDVGKLTAEITEGSFEASDSVVDRIEAAIIAGDFSYDCSGTVEFTNLNLYTQLGMITVNGETDSDGVYEQNYALAENDITVEIGTGDVSVTYIPAVE